MIGRQPAIRKPHLSLLRWLLGTAITLATFSTLVFWSESLFEKATPTLLLESCTWFAPLSNVYVLVAASAIAALCFARFREAHWPGLFRISQAFGGFTILSFPYALSWPGTVSNWLWLLRFSLLAVFLLAAALAPSRRADVTSERRQARLGTVGSVFIAAMGIALMVSEASLPPILIDSGSWAFMNFDILVVTWLCANIMALAVGTALSAIRYQQTGDSILGYLALTQLVLAFAVLSPFFGRSLYDLWWYCQRIFLMGGCSVLMLHLLHEALLSYRRELEKTRDLQVLVDTIPIGIIFFSAPEGYPLLSNKAAETILGQPLVPDLSIQDNPAYYGICLPDGEPISGEDLPATHALLGEDSDSRELLIRQPSGREVHILTNSASLRDANGQVVGAIVSFKDITPIREQESLRDEFLSAAAHELKTPVATIKGYVQLMSLWTEEERLAHEDHALKAINAQTDRINKRVEEMLEAVRLRQATTELHRLPFDLGELAERGTQRLQAMTRLHRLTLQNEESVLVEADPERIEETLVGLLDNAMKYSPPGGDIVVRVRSQNGQAEVSIKDNGVGIPKERQAHVFEPFYEPVPSGATGYQGVVALSLYLAKLNVERHGGQIWFESEEGKGSNFFFTLPLAPKR